MMNLSIVSVKRKKCTGCKLCGDVCPVGAISFENDKFGFWYPVVDGIKCTDCGLCCKKCPIKNKASSLNSEMPLVYEAWSKEDKIRLSSTSGGVFWELAKQIINNGGLVAGCVYAEDWKSAKHIVVSSLVELEKVKGSKYFQSDTEGVYITVKKSLQEGREVLFCGTPCQCDAVRIFCDDVQEKLILVDFICRSINSPMAFKKFIEEQENTYQSFVKRVQLKNKDYGWQSLATKIEFENGAEYYADKNTDLWVKGFIYNDFYTRESCETCKYKTLPRETADISIGDFWGIKGIDSDNMFKGISVILANSEKGKQLVEKSDDTLHIKRRTIEDVLPGNPALLNNVNMSKNRDIFWDYINSGKSFSKAINLCTRKSFFKRLSRLFMIILRIINKLILGDISLLKYIKYNYFCKNIERHNGNKILPHYGTVINFAKGAKIILDGHDLEIGYNKLKGSRCETHIRLDENSLWECLGGGLLFYKTVVELKENAHIKSGFFSANSGSVIISDKSIILGEDVMIGRNVLIYDSDFHQILNEKGEPINPPKEVIIGDHVWLTSNITVLKGVSIGDGCLVTAQTVVNKDTPAQSVIASNASGKAIRDNIIWNRNRCK